MSIDSAVQSGSSNLISSGAVASALQNVDPTITENTDTTLSGVLVGSNSKVGVAAVDTAAITSSSNLITSGAVASGFNERFVTVQTTASAYEALPSEQKQEDILYIITDDSSDSGYTKAEADSKFAPSGYGLGVMGGKLLTSADDLNNVKANGFYSWHVTSYPSHSPIDGRNSTMLVQSISATYLIQRVNIYVSNFAEPYEFHRVQINGTWKPWIPTSSISISFGTLTGTGGTTQKIISNDWISQYHDLVNLQFNTPSAVTGSITWTTADGSITLNVPMANGTSTTASGLLVYARALL